MHETQQQIGTETGLINNSYSSALCKRDVGAGGQNFKKAIFHTFFIEYDKK